MANSHPFDSTFQFCFCPCCRWLNRLSPYAFCHRFGRLRLSFKALLLSDEYNDGSPGFHPGGWGGGGGIKARTVTESVSLGEISLIVGMIQDYVIVTLIILEKKDKRLVTH